MTTLVQADQKFENLIEKKAKYFSLNGGLGFDTIQHVLEHNYQDIWAIRTALSCGRPLLLRGDPGLGKSQIARLAASILGWRFVIQTVDATSTCQDLCWHEDAIARLAEAQIQGALQAGDDDQRQSHAEVIARLAPQRFIKPESLWWSFDWEGACKHCEANELPPDQPPHIEGSSGTVLLLDEIDKADTDVPNGLLDVFGHGGFNVPHVGRIIKKTPVLVVITTNEERVLPAAFLRRCVVYKLSVPEENLVTWLVERGHVHFPQLSIDLCEQAADSFVQQRGQRSVVEGWRPSLAEYLDLLRVLDQQKPEERQHLVEQLMTYFVDKQASDLQ